MQQAGLIVKTNEQLDQEELAQLEAEREAQAPETVQTQLAAHVRRRFEVMRRHKEPIEKRMLANLRRLAGRYSDQKRAEIENMGLPLIYMQIASVKSRAAKSWIRDVLMPAGDRPWELEPSQRPDVAPKQEAKLARKVLADAVQYMQMTGQPISRGQMRQKFDEIKNKLSEELRKKAEDTAERMANVIEDQLVEGQWETALNEVISDVVDYPAAILKAPVQRRDKALAWEEGRAVVKQVIKPYCERVDPFRFYTCPGITQPDEGDCIEVHEYSADSIHDLIGLPGYDEDAIRRALKHYEHNGYSSHYARDALRSSRERARGQYSGTEAEENIIEVLEYWGSVSGRMLLDWGMDAKDVPDAEAQYDVMVKVLGDEVIAVRFNPDPLGRKPYHKACFEPVPGAFWGKGVPDLVGDCEDVCNAAARALVANMGIGSGPQVAVNTASLAPGQEVETMYPWKIWQLDFTKTGGNGSRPPIDFFQPNNVTAELMAVYKEFSQLADEYSGIPAYSYGVGEGVGGAGRTASGLSMLMNAASKAIKNVIKQLDTGIIQPTVHRYYVHNMMWHPDERIKGDLNVKARGALALVSKEQNLMRLQEFMQMTANEFDMSILGVEGRAAMLRHAAEGLEMGADRAVPSDEDLRRKQLEKQLAARRQMAMQQEQEAAQRLRGGNPAKSREANAAGQPMGSTAPNAPGVTA